MKKVFSLLMAVMLVMSLAVPAAAAENEGILTFLRTGGNNAFYRTPGDQTATNLFGDGFKNVMPGDKVSGTGQRMAFYSKWDSKTIGNCAEI